MATSLESQNAELNQFPILRYDLPHGTDTTEDPDVFENDPSTSGRADMDVSGAGSVQGAYPVNPLRPATNEPPSESARPISSPTDELDISPAGKLMESLSQSEVRAQRLAQIRAEIEAGTYETPEKLEAALTKLLGEIDEQE